ncbi:transcriptional regulator family: Fungal Specific TF [Penicillium paradoxum]|uniref:transcriptional regulator family: Fungal Specific TF n=1 Tax=Penicillium paradoxum TaxID=176176 RepID=UPI002548E670|nr:transcriptional regulator family: Fungal Specific TF [Penicillium paradoxum]KAJ5780668.1 transcriptional regulator family: Fungal Specific TF [Penicillium paradoxum]
MGFATSAASFAGMRNLPFSEDEDHSFDCVYRTSDGSGTEIASNKRKRDVEEPQRTLESVSRPHPSVLNQTQRQKSTGRPSPWPIPHQSDRSQSVSNTNRLSSTGTPQTQSAGLLRVHPRAAVHTSETTIPSTRPSDDSHSKHQPPKDLKPTKLTISSAPTSEIGDAASRDGLSGVNLHTNGTEFYGNSSNLAFLGNLYMRAQNQAESRDHNQPDEASQPNKASPHSFNQRSQLLSSDTSHEKHDSRSSKSQLSIVNLLYNVEYTGHPTPQSHNGAKDATQMSPGVTGGPNKVSPNSNGQDTNLEVCFPRLTETAQLEIEKIFIGSYFANKHYIHPLLCKGSFMQRCESEAWPSPKRSILFRGATKFAGLYFAVVALGAINASPNETSLLEHFCQQSVDEQQPKVRKGSAFTALDFAKFFFGLAKGTLGNLFESSCLESAQTLFLMSVFLQNSLQPHSCYMYSGMAARTAAAIGLGSSMSLLPPSARREARRTWWCIYSHEIEMCCSSGRLDSMKELHYYQTSLPKLKIDTNDLDPDAEDNDIAMIPVMVALSRIMSEASHQLYHSTRLSLSDKSHLAMSLDHRLLKWKANIPSFLNLDAHALNDPEWAFKQKLVLRLRYYNTRILIHKPFLVAATANTTTPDLSTHLQTCLAAARTSINMQYESFMHRIYIRTWWYNTTYALYGSMILLHLILSNYPNLPDTDLLEDVEKSLQVFSAMDEIIVARRCAEMLREVLEVARTCLTRRRGDLQNPSPGSGMRQSTDLEAPSRIANASVQNPLNQTTTPKSAGASLPALSMSTPGLSLDPPGVLGQQDAEDGDFFFSLFSSGAQTQPDRTRAEMLANLVDSSVLEDFAFGGNEFSFF